MIETIQLDSRSLARISNLLEADETHWMQLIEDVGRTAALHKQLQSTRTTLAKIEDQLYPGVYSAIIRWERHRRQLDRLEFYRSTTKETTRA